MDRDVELSMRLAHDKWIGKMLVFIALSLLGSITFWVHTCNKASTPEACVETVFNPAQYYKIQCPDPRQTLTFPEGWTWAKCSCPSAKP
jgi:hypothetical protein